MRNSLAVTAMCLALPVGMLAQAGAAGAQQGGGGAPGITATLTKGVDAKKAKVGDPVTAKTTGDFSIDNKTKVASGSKLSGHVTEAQPRADGQASRLAVVFDTLEPKGGQPIAMKLQVAGVANAASASGGDADAGMSSMPSSGGSAGGGSSSGSAGGASSAPSMPTPSMPSSSMTNQAAAPTTGSTIKDVSLGSDAVLTSSKKDINLYSGTVLTLTMAQPQPGQPPAGE